jgi:hypothetical protein
MALCTCGMLVLTNWNLCWRNTCKYSYRLLEKSPLHRPYFSVYHTNAIISFYLELSVSPSIPPLVWLLDDDSTVWELSMSIIHFEVRSHTWEKRLFASSCPSVCPHGATRHPSDAFSWNLMFWIFFANMSRKFKFDWNLCKNNRYLTWRRMYVYDDISLSPS